MEWATGMPVVLFWASSRRLGPLMCLFLFFLPYARAVSKTRLIGCRHLLALQTKKGKKEKIRFFKLAPGLGAARCRSRRVDLAPVWIAPCMLFSWGGGKRTVRPRRRERHEMQARAISGDIWRPKRARPLQRGRGTIFASNLRAATAGGPSFFPFLSWLLRAAPPPQHETMQRRRSGQTGSSPRISAAEKENKKGGHVATPRKAKRSAASPVSLARLARSRAH